MCIQVGNRISIFLRIPKSQRKMKVLSVFSKSLHYGKARYLVIHCWLVVWTHLKNISQLGWLFPIYGKIKMFQTTNQIECHKMDSKWGIISNHVPAFKGIVIRLSRGPGAEYFPLSSWVILRVQIWWFPEIGVPPVTIHFGNPHLQESVRHMLLSSCYPRGTHV